MEPITTLLMTAIALGAAAGLKPTTEQAVKDAYAGLKQVLRDRYAHRPQLMNVVEALHDKPQDTYHQATLERELREAGALKDPALIDAATAIYVAGEAQASKKRVLGKRMQVKLRQVEALEAQVDLSLDEGQKVILQEKVGVLWEEIGQLEKQLAQKQAPIEI